MATASDMFRSCSLMILLIFQVHSSAADTPNPTLQAIQMAGVSCNKDNCQYLLAVHGGEFVGENLWRLTPEAGAQGSSCEILLPNYEINEIGTTKFISMIEVTVPNIEGKIYFCLRESVKEPPFVESWVHQGVEHVLEPKKDFAISQKNEPTNTTEPISTTQDEETETQTNENLEDFTASSETLEANPEWAEKEHIEVKVNNKYVPLKDLINIENGSIESISIIELDHDDDTFSYAKESRKILNILRSKLKPSKSKREVTNVNSKLDKVYNISNGGTYLDVAANSDPNNVSPIDTHSPKSDQEIQEDEYDSSNATNWKQDLGERFKIIDQLPVEIQSIRRVMLQAYSPSKPSPKEDSNTMHSPGIQSPDVHPTDMHSPDILPTDMHSPDIHPTGMHSPDIHATEMYSPDLPSPETDSPDLSVVGLYISDTHSSVMHSPDVNTHNSNTQTPDMSSPGMHSTDTPNERTKRQLSPEVPFVSVKAAMTPIVIEGIRVEDADKEPKIIEGGIPSVLAESPVTLRVYGEGLTERTVVAFTQDPQPYGQPCKFLLKGEYTVIEGSLQPKTALFDISAPASLPGSKLYICAKNLHPNKDATSDEEKYLHQGVETWKIMASHSKLLPLWFSISLILFCLLFSALFSGLNLGLMSLDRTELKIIANTGTEQERKYARAIMPVRDHGNYLLCSILLGNVAVNSTFTILLDELTSGLFAVIFSTLAIVMLGEITPQAICSRHGLMVGAKSIMVTKGVMAVTAPLSFPVSKLLDYFLGEEIGNVYNRERLKELVKVTFLSQLTTDVNDLDKDEVNIISGALEMRKKTVKHVMTKLEDVFMLPISSVLDFETMSEIVKSGYSRIPVYEGGRGNIVTVLFIKDLAFVDPDDNTPLRTLCQYYQNAAHFVFEDVTLDVIFKQFKDGHKGHMAFVHRINNEGEGDPFYETIGLVTLEDVIEEMIQSEIVDETDVFLDNRSKRRRRPQNKLQDFAAFAERHDNQRINISPQLTLATFQFLSTSVDAFRPDTVSETVLRRLLKQDVIQHIKIKEKSRRDLHTYVYQQGKPVDYFVLILEGRVEVTVGRENLVFEAGPFTYFGVQALTQNVGVAESPTPSAMGSLQNINMDAMLRHTFVPDYSVRAITSVFYLTVKRSLYLAAKRATLMEKGNISKGGTTQEFDTEVDKLLQSVDEDLSITGEHKTPSRQVSPNPVPASPAPRSIDARNGHAYAPTHRNSQSDEQERLLK